MSKLKNNGFTIIELMIATSVLSVILVMVTLLMISIGNLYYKGVNQARVQDNVRSISDELGQHLQLTSQSPSQSNDADRVNTFPGSVTVSAYCIDNTRYSFITGTQVGKTPHGASTAVQHVLWRDTIAPGSVCDAADLTSSNPSTSVHDRVAGVLGKGTELIAPRSRLTQFCIGTIDAAGNCAMNPNSPYTIEVGVAYGDDDLLNHVNAPPLNSPGAVCAGGTGDQFCSTAYLSTTVVKRLTNNSL